MRLGVKYRPREPLLFIITMKLMKLAKTTGWIFLGFLDATGATHAQEVTPQTARPAAQNIVDSLEQLLRNAEALIESGKPGEAYNLLEPLEFEHAGEVRFDYLIGIAALDSGKPDKATFAFERVLAVNPDFAAARLDMARAYYQLGDYPRARTEFSAALKQTPTESARANILKYLDAIDAQGKRTHYTGYLELGVGHDSNVNSSTNESQVYVDLFSMPATLDTASVKTADNYYAAAAGGEINQSLNAHWRLHAGADLRNHANSAHAEFDSVNMEWRAGATYETRANRLRVSLIGGQYNLGGARNNDTNGYKGEWRHVFNPGNQLNAFAQSVQYRYATPLMQPNDIDQEILGLGGQHVTSDGKSALSGSVHYGTEKDVSPVITSASPDGGRNDGAKRFRGLRLGGQTAINNKTTMFASAGIQIGDYDKVNYYFQRLRKDRLYDLKLGANWNWDKLWTLRPQLSYSRNDSNIAIYGYDRMDVSLTIRRDFR